jgi:Histidine phosphatase superfamily (branch 1)
VKTIDNIGDAEIQDVAIPTGIPIVYKFERDSSGKLQSTPPSKEEHSVSQVHMNGKFLEKPGLLKEALKREEEWSKSVPGYEGTMSRHKRPMTGLERSLYKLEAERELGKWASEFIDWNALEDDGNDGNFGKPISLTEDEVWAKGMKELENGVQFDPDAPIFHDAAENATATAVVETIAAELSLNVAFDEDDNDEDDKEVIPTFFAQPCVTAIPASEEWKSSGPAPTRLDSVIVIIRHGKTQHNKLGLFTGWEDAPLADEGIEEAKEAGRLLKLHGFEFDVVYTSWLSRALETALYVMDEMDSLWLPTVCFWSSISRCFR